jgi:hypothetical protein
MDFTSSSAVEPAANVNDIKRAISGWRRFHPDINPGDQMAATHFRQIAEPTRRWSIRTAGATTLAATRMRLSR